MINSSELPVIFICSYRRAILVSEQAFKWQSSFVEQQKGPETIL